MRHVVLIILLVLLIVPALAADSGINITTTFSGNSTWANYTIIDQVTAACPHSTSTVYNSAMVSVGCYNQTNVDDMSYGVSFTGNTASGTVYESGSVWFRKLASPIAGMDPEFALWIALFLLMFTALIGATTPSVGPVVAFVFCFEGWVLWGMNMFVLIDSGLPNGEYTIPVVLTIATFASVLWGFVDFRRKGK